MARKMNRDQVVGTRSAETVVYGCPVERSKAKRELALRRKNAKKATPTRCAKLAKDRKRLALASVKAS